MALDPSPCLESEPAAQLPAALAAVAAGQATGGELVLNTLAPCCSPLVGAILKPGFEMARGARGWRRVQPPVAWAAAALDGTAATDARYVPTPSSTTRARHPRPPTRTPLPTWARHSPGRTRAMGAAISRAGAYPSTGSPATQSIPGTPPSFVHIENRVLNPNPKP